MIRQSTRRRLARVARQARHQPARTGPLALCAERIADLTGRLARRKWTVRLLAAVAAAAMGHLLGGPVASLIAVTYSMFGVCAGQLRWQRRSNERAGVHSIEVIGTLAGELRAGGGPLLADGDPFASVAVSGVDRAAPPVREAAERVSAARRISERLGAPLADLLDRIEDDLRSRHRLRAAVTAKTAGCRATAALLAVLPVAGLALGAGMGADPTHQLLRTPLGAGCATAALLLQVSGLIWTSRMVRAATEAV